MADIALLAPGVAAAPEGYQIPGAQEIIVKAVTATYDGTDAAGAFVPTLQVIAPNGTILASCPTSTALVAGASADVSWFPRSGVSSSSGGSGIQFDVENEGDWLDIQTDGTDPNGVSVNLVAPGGGINIFAGASAGGSNPGQIEIGAPGGTIQLGDTAGGGTAFLSDGPQTLDAGGDELRIQSHSAGGTNGVRVQAVATGKLSFFNVTPVVKQGTPVTLANVISLLQAYGLCA